MGFAIAPPRWGLSQLLGLGLLLVVSTANAGVLDLKACVELALARSPEILDAVDGRESALVGLELAENEYELQVTPSVDGGFQGSNTTNQSFELRARRKFLTTGAQVDLKGSSRVFSTVPQLAVPYFSEARITIAQPLFQGWTAIENRAGIDEAERRIVASEHGIEMAREDAVFQVVRSYYEVVRATQLLEVAQQSLRRMRTLKASAETRLDLGKVSKMDVYRVELQQARIETALADQGARRASALDQLKLLLGLDPRIEIEIAPHLQGPSIRDLRNVDLNQQAEDERAEVREARAEVGDSQRKLVLAKYGLWPSVDLVGSYAQQGIGESFGESFNLDRSEWNVGFRSSVPLDRTAQKAALTEAEIALRSRERRYRQVRDQVISQVRQAMRQLDRARAASELAVKVATQSAQQENLARMRYEKGLTDNFDLVQAEEQLTEARANQILAEIDQALAAAAVRRSTGTLSAAFVDGATSCPSPPREPRRERGDDPDLEDIECAPGR